MVVVVTKSLFWTLWTLLRPRVWGGDRDMEARGPNEGTSGVRGGGKHSNTILDHWSSIADCIRVSLILSILQSKGISAAQMEFTQLCSTIWWVHNTMWSTHCVHVSAAHFHNGFFGHGDAAILKPHMWRHEQTICQIRCKVKQLELGQEKKHFAYICTLEQLSEMSSALFPSF